MKIVITDAQTVTNGDLSFDFLKQYGEVVIHPLTAPHETKERIADADMVLCNKTVLNGENLAGSKVRYIGLFATGYNNIDTSYTNAHGITVCNAGSYSTTAVAQQTMAYLMEFFTKTARYNDFVHAGGWKTSTSFSPFVFPAREMAGKTLGIIGYGSIGRAVAKRALAFDMRVLVHTRTPKEDSDVTFVTLDELLAESDAVSIHTPLTDATKGLFGRETFAKMKDGAYFINTARGAIHDEDALIEALDSGKLSGAGIDVLASEPMPQECRLPEAKNIIITPHVAWAPLETRQRLLTIVEDNITAFLAGAPIHVVG